MAVRKIELMHQMFGRSSSGLCKECSHFGRIRVGDRKLVRKCEVYGVTASEASDWCASYPACGLFNTDYVGRNVIDFVRPEKKKEIDSEPIDGQITLLT